MYVYTLTLWIKIFDSDSGLFAISKTNLKICKQWKIYPLIVPIGKILFTTSLIIKNISCFTERLYVIQDLPGNSFPNIFESATPALTMIWTCAGCGAGDGVWRWEEQVHDVASVAGASTQTRDGETAGQLPTADWPACARLSLPVSILNRATLPPGAWKHDMIFYKPGKEGLASGEHSLGNSLEL